MAAANKSSLCLLGALAAWMLLTDSPAYRSAFPEVSLRWKAHLLRIASFQLVSFLLTQLCALLAFGHLYEVSGGTLLRQPRRVVLSLLLISTLQYGQGLHDICVMVEAAGTGGAEEGEGADRGSAMSSSLTALVDFWHEIVSHNMFVGSFFLLLLLGMRLEGEQSLVARSKKTDERNSDVDTAQDCNAVIRECANSQWAVLPFCWLEWISSVIVGRHFALYSLRTSTWAITLLFFAAVLIMRFTSSSSSSNPSHNPCVAPPSSRHQLAVSDTMTKVTLVGIPILTWQLIST